MRDCVRHPSNSSRVDRLALGKIKLSADAAHSYRRSKIRIQSFYNEESFVTLKISIASMYDFR